MKLATLMCLLFNVMYPLCMTEKVICIIIYLLKKYRPPVYPPGGRSWTFGTLFGFDILLCFGVLCGVETVLQTLEGLLHQAEDHQISNAVI